MRKGFTLLEILVVFAILGVIIGIAIPMFTRYTKKAYRGTVISDVKNAILSVETFIADYKTVPADFSCPTSGYGPAVCDLTDGTNTIKDAVSVSQNVLISYEKLTNCGGSGGETYKIQGTHALLPNWGFCFDACRGEFIETDGSGCP
ncbi:type IV pilin protein [Hydrogenivirga sp.]